MCALRRASVCTGALVEAPDYCYCTTSGEGQCGEVPDRHLGCAVVLRVMGTSGFDY